MPASVGKRYVAPSGAEVIVTKGGPGVLSDGDVPLMLKGEAGELKGESESSTMLLLGKRYKSADGMVELLVIKTGACDLRYDGAPMNLQEPKVLPSAD